MSDKNYDEHHIQYVTNFHDLVNTTFHGSMNAICWNRKLSGDFLEIVKKL
jgi:hypothetical protein